MKQYSLSLLSVAVTAAALSASAGALTLDAQQSASFNLVGDPSITVGSEANPISQALYANGSGAVGTASGDTIAVYGNPRAIQASTSGELNIGTSETSRLTVSATGGESAIGVLALKGGHVVLAGQNISVTSDGFWSVLTQNNTDQETAPEGTASVVINGGKTTISAPNGYAMSAYSNGYLEINGDLTATDNMSLMDVRGHSTTNINQKGDGTVVLKGDIAFETPGSAAGSGNEIDATVNINLKGSGSSWTGNVFRQVPESWTDEEIQKNGQVAGLNLALSDGAAWNVTDPQPWEEGEKSSALAVNSVKLDNGVINVTQSPSQSVDVTTLSGTGGTLNVAAEKTNGTLKSAKVNVSSVASGSTPKITENYVGITADQASSASDLDTLRSLSVNGGTQGVDLVQNVAEGDIVGAITRETKADGTVGAVVESRNSRQEAFGALSKASILTWRHETNDLEKRMGELRDSAKGVGTWVRVYGSEQEYGAQNLTTKNNSVQLGADFDLPHNWKLGAAFSYTDSDTSYKKGSGDGDTYTLSVYGTWMDDSGLFVDLIGKYGRISTDFSLNGFSGSYDNNAFSLSAEAGWHWNVNESVFVEPQAELTYSYVDGDKFRSASGTTIDQDNFNSLVGRLGVRAGLNLPQKKGTIYARVSGAYEFEGDYKYKASNALASRSYKDELDGGWVEYAVGANFNLSKQAYTYLDLERTSCGDIKENWRWNVGLRYVW
ncbi:autotransporter outer membrane beta-barrel domain-containing protein [Mesosutterella sp. OilRF-GAM-744-9]|uniref:Autotransporter outer membrane beta-barrel domain-containing protein n=1 Tax=Mesosutterella porci TaxID=2915351 RepID=A0ABS9MQP8_9BURK|nr:autotransporter outer membrane beta-barrel domain-containing protein [Mesosutterella sp. oilRF-744-WT-GAM-9]MCG5030712.1 autotransporter outer membrane beta-barrel domain-containing protein [Mesosutterella sp. oilRF-744-WT-GAM-9]